MSDRTSEIENYNELKFSREQGFFDKSVVVRILIGILFVGALFILLHFREVRLPLLELNSLSPEYIVAPVDVDFFDEETTLLLRQEAVRGIGKIYTLAEKSIQQRRSELENFLVYNQGWREHVDKSPFESMYRGLNLVEGILVQLHFTDPRTLEKMKELQMPTNYYVMYAPRDFNQEIILPDHVWDYVKKKAFKGLDIEPSVADFLINSLQSKTWFFQADTETENNLRKKIQAKVNDNYGHLNAGSRVIAKDEKVTGRHVLIMQAIKQKLIERRNLTNPTTIIGSLIMTLLLTAVCVAYFRINHLKILYSNRKLFLLVTILVITFFLAKVAEFLLLNSQHDLIDAIRFPLFVPFAAILLCSLMNPSIATFVSAFLTVVLTLTLAFDQNGFMILNLVGSLVAIFSTRSLHHRKEIFIVCGKAWLFCVALIIGMDLYAEEFNVLRVFADILCAGVSLLLTAILVVGLLPLLESIFRIMTDVTLMEYMDPNNDLLRRLTIEAPGTYQHSVVVGNLAESAATAIGANGLFARVATLYHDAGKMATPQYFTENQVNDVNMHQLLTPQESAQVIMHHVSEGVALARKAGLPEQFIDIIKEHHGTTLVYYFYRKQLDLMGGDTSKVNEREFRYAGPKPRSKESAIIMIADSVEAASRSLDKVTEESLTALAHRLIREKADDGQFDECLLTFEELSIVKQTLVKTLVAFAHARIKYPSRDVKTEVIESIIET